ncbi:MAG: carboxypeptidase-like regulatory domain-containing protein, partial [Anaerolineae bacterium]
TYSISGRVVDGSGNPISGVTLSDNAGHTTTTGSDGRYTLSGLAAGTYTVTPSKSGYTFSPTSRTVTVPPDATGVDFTGTAVSVWVEHIEVTQATQDVNNSVPLIAGKPAFVRVYVSCGPDGQVPPGAAVALRGYGPSGELPGSPLAPFGGYLNTACREGLEQQRADLRKTLNFALPNEWTQGTITLRAEVGAAAGEGTFTFQPARTLSIRYVPIHYNPFPLCVWLNQDPDPARIATAYQWAQKVYPTARIEYLPWPGMDWGIPLRKLACLGSANLEAEKALNFSLSLQWSLAEGPRPNYVFGWLPDEASGGGMADPHWPDWPGIGVAAHGDDDPNHGPRIFAHEVGHLLGRRHTRATSDPRPSCANLDTSPYNDWLYSTAGIQDYGVDIDTATGSIQLQRPSEAYDYMSYCWYWYNLPAWTSPHTYRRIYSDTLHMTGLALQSLSTPQPYFIASGLVYTDDTATLDPIWVITPTAAPENPPAGTQYCL